MYPTYVSSKLCGFFNQNCLWANIKNSVVVLSSWHQQTAPPARLSSGQATDSNLRPYSPVESQLENLRFKKQNNWHDFLSVLTMLVHKSDNNRQTIIEYMYTVCLLHLGSNSSKGDKSTQITSLSSAIHLWSPNLHNFKYFKHCQWVKKKFYVVFVKSFQLWALIILDIGIDIILGLSK